MLFFGDCLARAVADQAGSHAAGPASHVPPDGLIIVPVRNAVLFPGTVFPIALGRERSVLAAQQAVREERPVGLLMQRDPEQADPSGLDLHRTGTVANVLR
jgi:ATP-dependent Lon protease